MMIFGQKDPKSSKNLLKMYNLLKKGNTCNNKVFKGGLYEKE